MNNRQIVLDTETTGLEPKQGHRIIEIAGVELIDRRLTGRHFHRYLNPDREIDAGAMAVHGITNEFLTDKPRFPDIVAEFLDYVADAELVIHNAAFDIGFLNHELAMVKREAMNKHCAGVLDTLRMARELHPGKRNNLDALCERYAVANAHRNLHGALLDAELLAEVYLAMTRGQDSLIIEAVATPTHQTVLINPSQRGPLKIQRASAEETRQHNDLLDRLEKELKGPSGWRPVPIGTQNS